MALNIDTLKAALRATAESQAPGFLPVSTYNFLDDTVFQNSNTVKLIVENYNKIESGSMPVSKPVAG